MWKLSCVNASFCRCIYFPIILNLRRKEDRIQYENEIRFLYINGCIGKFTHAKSRKNYNAIILNHIDCEKSKRKK